MITGPDIISTVVAKVTATVHPTRRWKVGAPATLKDDLGLDQVDRLTIACAIDEALGIEIPDHEIERWETVADVTETAERIAAWSRPPVLIELTEEDRQAILAALARPCTDAFVTQYVAQPNWQALGFAGLEDAEGRN